MLRTLGTVDEDHFIKVNGRVLQQDLLLHFAEGLHGLCIGLACENDLLDGIDFCKDGGCVRIGFGILFSVSGEGFAEGLRIDVGQLCQQVDACLLFGQGRQGLTCASRLTCFRDEIVGALRLFRECFPLDGALTITGGHAKTIEAVGQFSAVPHHNLFHRILCAEVYFPCGILAAFRRMGDGVQLPIARGVAIICTGGNGIVRGRGLRGDTFGGDIDAI